MATFLLCNKSYGFKKEFGFHKTKSVVKCFLTVIDWKKNHFILFISQEKLLRPQENRSSNKSIDNVDNPDMGPKVADWRFGPAQVWYDMLDVPETGEGFNYGFKIKEKVTHSIVKMFYNIFCLFKHSHKFLLSSFLSNIFPFFPLLFFSGLFQHTPHNFPYSSIPPVLLWSSSAILLAW